MNNIKFNIGDTVCLKSEHNTTTGLCIHFLDELYPLRIINIYPDNQYDNRNDVDGEIGSCNVYQCYNLENETITNYYQYALCLWKEQKESIIQAYKDRIEKWSKL